MVFISWGDDAEITNYEETTVNINTRPFRCRHKVSILKKDYACGNKQDELAGLQSLEGTVRGETTRP